MAEKFVIDTSVVMTWCFEDESSRYGDRVLDLLTDAIAVAPAVWPLEVANSLLVAERKKRLTRARSSRFLTILRTLPIFVSSVRDEAVFGTVFGLGRETGLSAYDASYLQLALRDGLPLATLDAALRRAARKVSVPLVQV